MSVPKSSDIGKETPQGLKSSLTSNISAIAPHIPTPRLRTLGPGSVASLLKIVLDTAYVIMIMAVVVLSLMLVAGMFIPLSDLNVTVSDGSGGRELPLTRTLLLFGLGVPLAYAGAFLLILRHLRRIFRTLTIGDPFQPGNVSRLRQIGLTLGIVTVGVWIARNVIAARLAPGVLDPQGLTELMTPILSALVVFVLAEVFREGARLRRESELTI